MTDQAQRNNSRKYRLALVSLLLITASWIMSGLLPGLAQMFSELITGIMGILMLYFTGNVSNKFVVGRHLVEQAKITSQKASQAPGDSHGSK